MTTAPPEEVTQMLLDWSNGNKAALDRLIPVVHRELRRLARSYMRQERAGHTLQTTALVNEAYMRLVDYRRMRWQNRAHFFAVSAQVMRRILVEHARSRDSAKPWVERGKYHWTKRRSFPRGRSAEGIAI